MSEGKKAQNARYERKHRCSNGTRSRRSNRSQEDRVWMGQFLSLLIKIARFLLRCEFGSRLVQAALPEPAPREIV